MKMEDEELLGGEREQAEGGWGAGRRRRSMGG